MSKPWIHSLSSAKRFGGSPEDYLPIHNLLDSSKGAVPDNRHRALTHNSFFLSVILERIFGVTITNSDGKQISVRDVGEYHILEDFGNRFIPTAQDFLENMSFEDWMNNGRTGTPSSHRKIHELKTRSNRISGPQAVLDGKRPQSFDDHLDKILKSIDND